MARTLLNDMVHEQIVRAVRGGAPFAHASAMVGVGERTFYEWLQRGERYQLSVDSGLQPKAIDEPFARLRTDVYAARGAARVAAVATVTRAIIGEQDANGAWVTFPNWQAAA